jgi:transketolase
MTLAMRTAYRDWLVTRMESDPRTVCLDSDTGLFAGIDFGLTADRYLNLGIAEQNLMASAAGMAASGYRPFVNTMATFAASRAVEFVKIDIAYNNLPVCIAATHAGVSAGHLGPTHHCLEDLAVLRVLPNMTVAVPADASQVGPLLTALSQLPGPSYLRLDRKAMEPLALPGPLELGRLLPLHAGGAADVLLVAAGPAPVRAALGARQLLAGAGIEAAVVQAHTIVPFDRDGLMAAAEPVSLVVTVEEHWIDGGLGSVVAELLSETMPRRLLRVGLPRGFISTVGNQDELLIRHGISPEAITNRVRRTLDLLDAHPSMTIKGADHDHCLS